MIIDFCSTRHQFDHLFSSQVLAFDRFNCLFVVIIVYYLDVAVNDSSIDWFIVAIPFHNVLVCASVHV